MRYVWTTTGTCSIEYLRTGRYCKDCGYKKKYLVNVQRKKWQCLTCRLRNAQRKE
jgi:hypothetical protein